MPNREQMEAARAAVVQWERDYLLDRLEVKDPDGFEGETFELALIRLKGAAYLLWVTIKHDVVLPALGWLASKAAKRR